MAADALTYSPSTSTLTCISTGGPVTSVSWRRDGVPIPSNSSTYTQSQIVVDTATATYHNLLSINSSNIRDYNGTFSCRASNSRGSSIETRARVSRKSILYCFIIISTFYYIAIVITGNRVFQLGETSGISCSTPVPVQSIQWLNGSNREIELREEAPVQELVLALTIAAHHNNSRYTCTVRANGGFTESTRISVITEGMMHIFFI